MQTKRYNLPPRNHLGGGVDKAASKTTLSLRFPETGAGSDSVVGDFIALIYSSRKKSHTKVKIFSICLEEEKIITETPNPEYAAWEEKKRIFEALTDKKDAGVFLALPIPPKQIKTETIKKKLVSKQLNETEKDIDTLYLREKDKKKLLGSLMQFREGKHVLQELGLQNKLNMLLYGQPGVGKSASISCIATFLQKDIYYVDLQRATLNEDLQTIFEYVNKNVNGIVVLEDIDVMNDVVLKRTREVVETKVSQLQKEKGSKLSLEYMLNLLQGTLTMDDSVFIVTTNHIDHLDPAFYRDGRFDVKIELKLCDHHQIQCIYQKILKRALAPDILARIPTDTYSPATMIFHLKDYIYCGDMTDAEIMEKFLLIQK